MTMVATHPPLFLRRLQGALALLNGADTMPVRWKLGRLLAAMNAQWPQSTASALSGRLPVCPGRLAAELKRCHELYLAFPRKTAIPAALEWGHFRHLLRISNLYARDYYLAEAAAAHWKVKELARQIRAQSYERLLLHSLPPADTRQEPWLPEAVLRDPYVLEFLPWGAGDAFSEKQLEDAIVAHLPQFLLELGCRVAFIARQQRLHAGQNYFADLLFYHLQLRSYVVIDLKADPLSYADIGQMDLYVRLCDAFFRSPADNPSIGLILCPEKSEALQSYSLLKDHPQVWAAAYTFSLP